MGGGISKMAKQELVAIIRDRYQQSLKKEKGRISRRVHRDNRPPPQAWHQAPESARR